jgi:hypothetical protein
VAIREKRNRSAQLATARKRHLKAGTLRSSENGGKRSTKTDIYREGVDCSIALKSGGPLVDLVDVAGVNSQAILILNERW